jgi:hypothetical protein
MSTDRAKKAPEEPELPDQDDVEGHNLWISPTVSREMANARSREVEREARERQLAKEARKR